MNADHLDAIRTRTEEDRMAADGAGWVGDATCVGDREFLLSLLDAVRALHRPDGLGRCTCTQNYALGPWCKWPCPTIQALEGTA